MLLLIDNYDSFTYNLVHYLGELGEDVRVVRNDAMDVQAQAIHDSLLPVANAQASERQYRHCEHCFQDAGQFRPALCPPHRGPSYR